MDSYSQQVAKLFDEQAAQYDAGAENGHMITANTDFALLILETYLRLKANGEKPETLDPVTDHLKILDVGAGTGLTTLCLRQHFPGSHYHGIDISPAMLQRAKLKKVFDIARLDDITQKLPPVPANRFDITMSLFMFEYIRHWDRAIRNMARSLKPGGIYASNHFFFDDDEPCMDVFIDPDGSIALPPDAIKNQFQSYYPIKKLLLAAFAKNKLRLLPQPILRRSALEVALEPLQPVKQLFLLQKEYD